MKQIFLLRHAQALPAQGGSDIDRALSPKGKNDALALGHWLAGKDYIPDLIFCSPAKRTRQTCEGMINGLERDIETEFVKNIYDASRGEILNLIQRSPDHINTILVIGHNPTIFETALQLATNGPRELIARLAQGYVPASLTRIESDCENWSALDPEECRITDLADPNDYGDQSASSQRMGL